MSPTEQTRSGKTAVPNDIYTGILILAFLAVLVTAALVAYKCYSQYGTIFKIP